MAGSAVLRAVLVCLAGILLLDVMGVFIRVLSATYPASELAALRNFFGMIPSALLLLASAQWRASGKRLVIRQWRLAFLRGVFVTGAQLSFYLALTRMEFATVSTLAFASPLFVTALSVPVLGAQVGIWRWSAVLIGFAGIVMVMQPGSDAFTWAALLPLGAALGYASAGVTIRLIDTDVSSPLVNLYSSFAAMLGACVLMLIFDDPVRIASWHDLGMIVAMGTCGGLGVLFLIVAYRITEPANITPFEYFGIVFAFALGWFVFGEAPFDRLFPGVLLIVAGGLLIIWREREVKRRASAPQ